MENPVGRDEIGARRMHEIFRNACLYSGPRSHRCPPGTVFAKPLSDTVHRRSAKSRAAGGRTFSTQPRLHPLLCRTMVKPAARRFCEARAPSANRGFSG
jgi:hypothetical protein